MWPASASEIVCCETLLFDCQPHEEPDSWHCPCFPDQGSKGVVCNRDVEEVVSSLIENSPTLEAMSQILSLSYDNLPYHLKACMLSFSVFPEDYITNSTILLKRWVAEGFATEKHGLAAMDTAESYLHELINRCMIQPFQFSYDNKVYTVRVHDLMHDLIVSKSAEQNFVTRITSQQHATISRDKIHRLSVFCTEQEHISCIPDRAEMTHVRSLVIIGCIEQFPSLLRFRFLQILEIIGCGFLKNEDLNNIEKLFGLKMLVLFDVPVSQLPTRIGELNQLELLLGQKTRVKEFPNSIIQLKKLTHLQLDNSKLPEGLTSMKGLQKLVNFDICSSSTKAVLELGDLINMRMLTVYWNPRDTDVCNMHGEYLISSLKKLSNLQELYIRGPVGIGL
uniref:NB-ARC domain-containing protein n=1 Tax=Oryza brachyantha TaxID=4533 RepID=J3MI53_ORYBR